ncbi:hypothetical protein D3C83_159370 [compost metagenome]
MRRQRGADLHQLVGRLELLDEDVRLERAEGEPEVRLEGAEQLVPERRLFRGLDLR